MKGKFQKYVILLIVSASLGISVCGCRKTSQEENNMDYQAAEQFQKLMDQDKTGDKKSVEWDGTEAHEIEDRLDDSEILDGRGGYDPYTKVEKAEWSVKVDQMDEGGYTVTADGEEHYRLEGDDWYLEIRKSSFEDSVRNLNEDAGMKDVTENDLSHHIADLNSKTALYRGLKEEKGKVLAGYVLVLEDYFEHSYQVSYFGTGNMGDVKAKAMRLFSGFETDF